MTKENPTNETLPEEKELDSPGGEDGGSQGGEQTKAVKDVLSEALGKEFKDDESALKAVKDTFDYVGKAGQEKKELENQLASLKQDDKTPGNDNSEKIETITKKLEDMTFYADNPEYKPYDKLIKRFGDNPAEVVENEDFKDVFSKVKAAEEHDKSKSVLQSNPRLAKLGDKISDAAKKANEGDFEGAKHDAVDAVLDAYNPK